MVVFGYEISMWIIWYTLAALLLMIEFFAPGVFAIFFALAAIIVGTVSFITDNLLIQFILFVITSFIAVLFGKKTMERLFQVNKEVKPSTIDALIGKTGIIEKPPSFGEKGLVKIDGQIWTAKTTETTRFSEGDKVKVIGIEGVSMIIEKIEGDGEK